MNIELLAAFIAGVATLWLVQIMQATYCKWRATKPTPAEVAEWGRKFEAAGERCKTAPRVTPHTLMIGGWRKERRKLIEAMEEMRDVLIELRRLKLAGRCVSQSHKAAVREHLRTAGMALQDLNQIIDEDERANK